MLAIIAKHVKEVSVLRRLLFCAAQLNPEVLDFSCSVRLWRTTRYDWFRHSCSSSEKFGKDWSQGSCWWRRSSERASMLALRWTERRTTAGHRRKERNCVACGGQLLLRKDRPSYISVYDTHFGPLQGTHYHKKCSLTQYYGYHTTGGGNSLVVYNDNWMEYQYFVSSSLTAFSLRTLREADAQILIGQLSYQQIAEIFNHIHCRQSGHHMQ